LTADDKTLHLIAMSLEFALDKYPLKTPLKDGIVATIRPMRRTDEKAARTFYLKVPEHERLFIKESMHDGELFRKWCRELDYHRNLPLLLWHQRRIIGAGNLHQRQGGWKSHIGVVSVLSLPEFRGIGISRALIQEFLELARFAGLHRLEAQFNGERKTAIREFAMAGFHEMLRAQDYVKDMEAKFHEYVLMGRGIRTDEEYAGRG
jgi:GNAT superfamily N-acetyltransferase